MNREIKFRAFVKSQNKIINLHGFNKDYVFEDSLDSPEVGNNIFHIEDVILIQYTGLKDKNGVEIYEFDILEHSIDKCLPRLIVNWNKTNCEFRINNGIDYHFNQESCNKLTIIGNIYEK